MMDSRRDVLRKMTVPAAFLAGTSLSVSGNDGTQNDDTTCGVDEQSKEETVDGEISNTDSSNLTVSAYYYPWYGRGDHVGWTDETVADATLGAYDTRDPAVIDQHLEWCQNYGIDHLSMSWWGRDSPEDITIRDHILDRSLGNTEYSILYETPGLLKADNDGTYDLTKSANYEQLISDIEYMSETYFDDPRYHRIDGRPVINFWIAREFRGDIATVFQDMRDASNQGLYIVADLIRFGPPLDTDQPLIDASDAVTPYNMYSPNENHHEGFVEQATGVYDEWVQPLETANTEFMPVTMPGYNDSELSHVNRDNPPLKSSPDRFEKFCIEAQPYVTDEANTIFVCSFNEWYENTQIEPSSEFGTQYLDIIRKEFGTGSGSSADETDSETTKIELQFDRTISEDELEPGIENPRDLAVQCFALDVRDSSGNVIKSYDIGNESNEPTYEGGAYQPEQFPTVNGVEDSWRWFGGSQARTTLSVNARIEDAHSLVLHGGAAEGAIQVSVRKEGTVTDKVTIEGRTPNNYQFSLSTPNPELTGIELKFDRTVSEDELEPGIENPRDLAVQCFALDVRDSSGNVIKSYDIGSESNEPNYEGGAYQPEQFPTVNGVEDSWRWFGGSQAQTIMSFDNPLEGAESLVLRGGAAEGTIRVSTVRDKSVTDDVQIEGRSPDDYQLSLL